jgi:hypothetical protein
MDASMRKQKGAVGSQSQSESEESGSEVEVEGPSRSAVLTKAQLFSAANMFLSVVRGEPCSTWMDDDMT